MLDHLFLEPLKNSNQKAYKHIIESYKHIHDDILKTFNNIKEANEELDNVISLEYEGSEDEDVLKVYHNISYFIEIAIDDKMQQEYLGKALCSLDEVLNNKRNILYYAPELMWVLEELGELLFSYVQNKRREIKWLNIIFRKIFKIVGDTRLQEIISCANGLCNVTNDDE